MVNLSSAFWWKRRFLQRRQRDRWRWRHCRASEFKYSEGKKKKRGIYFSVTVVLTLVTFHSRKSPSRSCDENMVPIIHPITLGNDAGQLLYSQRWKLDGKNDFETWMTSVSKSCRLSESLLWLACYWGCQGHAKIDCLMKLNNKQIFRGGACGTKPSLVHRQSPWQQTTRISHLFWTISELGSTQPVFFGLSYFALWDRKLWVFLISGLTYSPRSETGARTTDECLQ